MLRQVRKAVILFSIPFLVYLFTSSVVCADSVPTFVLNSGTLTSRGQGSGFPFVLSGPYVSISGLLDDFGPGVNYNGEPLPGDLITISGSNSYSGVLTGQVIAGNTFAFALNGVSQPVSYTVFVNFVGSFTVPNVAPSPFTHTFPVTITGNLSVCDISVSNLNCDPEGLLYHLVIQGNATGLVNFQPHFSPSLGYNIYTIQSITYTLTPSPVPEPTSVLLFASGLFVILRRVHSFRFR